MKLKNLLLGMILIDFALFSGWVIWEVGYIGLWQSGFTSIASLQILLDLVLCASLIAAWLYQDARQRGINPWPWLVGVLLAGSLAPLLYLIVRDRVPQHQPQLA